MNALKKTARIAGLLIVIISPFALFSILKWYSLYGF